MNVAEVFETEKLKRKATGKRARLIVTVCVFSLSLMLVLMLTSSMIMSKLSKNPIFDHVTLSYLIDIAFYALYIVIPFAFAALIFKKINNNAEMFLPKRSSPKYGALYVVGTIGISYIINMSIGLLFPDFVEFFNNESASTVKDPLEIILSVIMIAVLPAVLEEWAFRGVLLKNMLPYGRGGAIVIWSVLFGLAHIDPPRIIFATAFGLMLGVCYEYTGSILVPMLIHFINNSISVIGTLIPQDSIFLLLLGFLMYAFMGCGIAAIIVYSIKGIKKNNISLVKRTHHGYSLSLFGYVSRMFLNFAFIPLSAIYAFILILSYFPGLLNGCLWLKMTFII